MTEREQTLVVYDAKRLPPPRAEGWDRHPRFTLYEVSDQGRHRRADKPERVLSQRTGTSGYQNLDFRDETGKKYTLTGQVAVLDTFVSYPCPRGQESLHGEYGPLVNWWPENLRRGSKKENEAEKPGLREPTFDCADRCGAQVRKESRRCPDCVAAAGRKLTRMLRAGMNLEVVAVRLDYSSDWAYRIAVEHGGYEGSKRRSRLQRPSLSQRVAITVRDRRKDGWGDPA